MNTLVLRTFVQVFSLPRGFLEAFWIGNFRYFFFRGWETSKPKDFVDEKTQRLEPHLEPLAIYIYILDCREGWRKRVNTQANIQQKSEVGLLLCSLVPRLSPSYHRRRMAAIVVLSRRYNYFHIVFLWEPPGTHLSWSLSFLAHYGMQLIFINLLPIQIRHCVLPCNNKLPARWFWGVFASNRRLSAAVLTPSHFPPIMLLSPSKCWIVVDQFFVGYLYKEE